MKVIDLLNKIANGEEVPKKIKYEGDTYILCDNYCYFCEETNLILSDNLYAEHSKLNEEVEIIEENKGIEKLEFLDNSTDNEDILRMKINEIIDFLNKKNKEIEEIPQFKGTLEELDNLTLGE